MQRGLSLRRYVGKYPDSGFEVLTRGDVEPIYMLMKMSPSSLALALYKIASLMEDNLQVTYKNKICYTNFAFIFVENKEFDNDNCEHTRVSISKKQISDSLCRKGFVSLCDDIETHKRSFVDCLLNRNVEMDKFYRLVRKSIPMYDANLKLTVQLNVMSATYDAKVNKLLTRKEIHKLGLMKRFVLLEKDDCDAEYVDILIKKIRKIVFESSVFSFRLDERDINNICKFEHSIHEELCSCVFIKENCKSLSCLYTTLLIKIYAIILMLRTDGKLHVVNSPWAIADVLARTLLNEKIRVLTRHSKSWTLFYALKDFIDEHKLINHRDIIRKFQSADKGILMLFIEYFKYEGRLKKGFFAVRQGVKKFPLHYFVDK